MKEMASGRGWWEAERAGRLLVEEGRKMPKKSMKKQNGHISGGGEAWEVTVKGSWTQELSPNRSTRCRVGTKAIHGGMLGAGQDYRRAEAFDVLAITRLHSGPH